MREKPCSRVTITWMALLAVAVFLISSPAEATWKNVGVPNVSADWTLYGVYAVSRTEAWAVGSDFANLKGVLLHYINGVWISVKPPTVSSGWQLFDVYLLPHPRAGRLERTPLTGGEFCSII